MHLGHLTRDDAHTRQSTFSWIEFVKTKLTALKEQFINLQNVGSRAVFSFKTLPQSVFVVLYMARWKNRKNSKKGSKIYLNSLWLSKTRKFSNVAIQMKVKREKSNDQIQVRLSTVKNVHTMKKLCKKLYSWLLGTSIPVSSRKTFTSSGNLASVSFPNVIPEKGKASQCTSCIRRTYSSRHSTLKWIYSGQYFESMSLCLFIKLIWPGGFTTR